MKRTFVMTAAAAALLVATGAQAETFIRIGSGLAGTYPVVGAKMAEIINANVEGVTATTIAGGTEANMALMAQGEVEIVLTYGFLTPVVQRGEGSLGVPTPQVRHLMTLYGAYFQPVASADTELTSLADIDDEAYRIWGANATSIFLPMIAEALEANGSSFDAVRAAGGTVDEIGYGDTAGALQDGRLDVGFFAGPAPYSMLMQIENQPGFTLMGFDEAAGEAYTAALAGTTMQELPAGTYAGQDEAVMLPYLMNEAVISADVPDEIVYEITKALVENVGEFEGLFAGSEEIQPETMLDLASVETHPGAMMFYSEAGLADD
ncbi:MULTISPECIES: TAXI family TRAP transporter solute-binding subunit [Salipiger]|uniref:TRAP-T family transporter, periplasmic substrate binding subunit n=1 Tax=Salipiger bermudensis (strain DSM 26914 / JCM 13377 / KCTC 12554 / HTCC2601) TaxID=314265 RepID=Q0FX12_SALBH|nr:TAXI family TRAP transporter solute-binding subunit [Salipiger bermudensis]EAU48390.1 TRAP-T family transporter, periplasmic substrate binding subunit [Salipiger bermudensis HTCC2601]MAE89329.1 TRAP transporter substrate-binding protein [Pelagibaca sp.]